ncbi:MAG: hypothetical protein WBC22_07900, partial [Sedimentisphaerales bacterium]
MKKFTDNFLRSQKILSNMCYSLPIKYEEKAEILPKYLKKFKNLNICRFSPMLKFLEFAFKGLPFKLQL